MYETRDPNPLAEHSPYKRPWIADTAFDLAGGHTFRPSINAKSRSLVIDFTADTNGDMSGFVTIYNGTSASGIPWAIVNAGELYTRPISTPEEGSTLTIEPSAGAQGIVHVTQSEALLGVFRDSGNSGGGAASPLAFGAPAAADNATYADLTLAESADAQPTPANGGVLASGWLTKANAGDDAFLGIGLDSGDLYYVVFQHDGNLGVQVSSDSGATQANIGSYTGANKIPSDTLPHFYALTVLVGETGNTIIASIDGIVVAQGTDDTLVLLNEKTFVFIGETNNHLAAATMYAPLGA
jgi:hypothetical protein